MNIELEKEARSWVANLPPPTSYGMEKDAIAPLLLAGLLASLGIGVGGLASGVGPKAMGGASFGNTIGQWLSRRGRLAAPFFWGKPTLSNKSLNYMNQLKSIAPEMTQSQLIQQAATKSPALNRTLLRTTDPYARQILQKEIGQASTLYNKNIAAAEAGATKGMAGGLFKSPIGMLMAGMLAAQVLPQILGNNRRRSAPMMTMPMMYPGGYA